MRRWSNEVRIVFGLLTTIAGAIAGTVVFPLLGSAPFLGPLGLGVGGVFGATLGYILTEPS